MPAASKRDLPTVAERGYLAAAVVGLALLAGTTAAAGTATTHGPPLQQAACERGFDFLYVVANEGGSSGGHAAVRFGPYTFHFQRTEDRLLRLQRDDSDRFVYQYAYLENRDVHVHHVATDPQTRRMLLDSFNRRYLVQSERVDLASRLRQDVELLAAVANDACNATGSVPIDAPKIAAAGYFFDRVGASPSPPTVERPRPAGTGGLARLRASIARAHGSDFLADRVASLVGNVDRANLAAREDAIDVDFTRDLVGAPTVAQDFVDGLAELAALRAITADRPLREGTYAAPVGRAFRLQPAELAGLRAYGEALADGLVDLVASKRPGRGYPLLVGLARLLAIERSLATGSLVFLDDYPDDVQALDGGLVAGRLERHPRLLEDAAAELAAARTRLTDPSSLSERDYAAVEVAANRLYELKRSVAGDRLRVARDPMLPHRGASIELGASASDAETTARRCGDPADEGALRLRVAVAQAKARSAAYDEALQAEYGYHLLRRNCVTEIFRTIDETWPDAPVRESTARLGGYVDPDAGLHFVPFLAARAVAAAYAPGSEATIASYRNLRLRRMYDAQSLPVVYLREVNTLTSSVYEREPDESLFVLYADAPVALRPLFGGFNLATGVLHTVAGLVRLPFEGPTALLAGLRGVVFSVPELAFVQLRRGTRAYVDAAEISALGGAPAAASECCGVAAGSGPERVDGSCHG